MSSSKSGSRTRGKEKPHICEICGKGHSSKRGLAIHANVHTREDLYRCDVCSESFSSYSLLRAHKHSHAEPKQVTCRICPKLFSTQAELTSHTLIHKAERPYECDTCGKKFDRQTLQCHMIVETGEKLYLCDTCFERSSKKSEAEKCKKAKSDAKAQKKSPSDTKTYPCHLCSATYSRSQDLKKHVEKHTRHKTKPAPVEKIIEKAVVIEPPAPKEKTPPPQPAPKEKPALPVVNAAPLTPEYNRSHSLIDYVTNLNTLIKTKEALLNQKNSSVRSECFFKRKERNPVLTSGVSSDDINEVCDANMRDVVVSKTATFHVAKSLTEHKKTTAFSLKKDGKINDKTDRFGLENEIDIFNEREAMFLEDIRDFPMIDETAIDEENDMLSLLSTDLLHAQHRNLEEQICESYSQMHVNDYFNIGLQEIARQYEDNDLLNAENFEADMRSPTLLYDHRNILSQDFNTVNNYNNLSDRHFKKTRQSGEDSGTVDSDIKVESNDESEIDVNTNNTQLIRNSHENLSSTQSGKHYTNITPSPNRYQNSPVKKTSLIGVDRHNDIGGHLISEYIDIEEQSTENFASLLVNDHFSIVDHDDVDHGSFVEDDDDYERINKNNTRNFSSMLIHQKRDFMTGNNKYAHSSAVDRRKILPSERNNKEDRSKAYIDEIDIKDEFDVHLNSENHRLEFQESISPLLLNLKPVNREVGRLLIQSEVLPKNYAIADLRVQETIIDKTTIKKRKDSFVSDESQDSEVHIEEDNTMPLNENVGTKVDSESRLSELMQGIELDRRPQTEIRNDQHNSRLLGTVSNKSDGKGCESDGSVSEIKTKNDPQYFGSDHQRVLEEDYSNTDDEIEHQINADNSSLIPVNVSCNDHEIIGCLDVEKSRHISRLIVKNQVFTVHLENEAEFNYDAHLNPEKSMLKKQTSTDSEIPDVEQQEIEIDTGRYVIDEEEYQQDDILSENRSVRSVDSDDINETYLMQDSNRQQKRSEEQTSLESSESNNDSRLTDDSPTTHERCKKSISISNHRVEESDNESNSKIMTDKDSNNDWEEVEEESDEKRVYVRFVYCPKNIDSGTNDSSSDTSNINQQEITRRNNKLTEVTVSEIHDQNLVTKNWTIDKKYCKLIIDQESVMQEGDHLLDDESVIYKYQSDEKDDQSFDNDTTNIDEEDEVVQCVVQDSETDDPDALADFSGNSNQIVVDEDTIVDYQEVEVKTNEIIEENFNSHYLRIAEDSEECVRVPMNERLIETDDDEMDAEYDNEDLYTIENSTEDQQETLAEDSEQSNQILDNECVNNDNQEIDLQSCSNENDIVYMQDSENSREIDESSMMDYQDDENASEKGDNHESFDENQTLADESLTTNREEVVIQYDQNNSPLSLNGNLIIDHEGNVLQYTDKSNQAFGNESLIIDHQEIIGQDSNTGDSALVHCYLIDVNQDNEINSNLSVNTETIDTQDLNKQSTAVKPVALTDSKDFDIESDTEKTQSSIIPTESNQWSEESQRIAVSEDYTQRITSQHRESPSDSDTTDKTDPVNHLSNDSNLIEQVKNAKEEDHLILNRNEVDEHNQITELLNDENDSQSTSHFENQLWQDSPVHSESHSTVSDDKTQDSSDDYNYNYEKRNDNYLENSDISQEMTSPKDSLDDTPTNADSIPVIESKEKDKTLISFDDTLPVGDDSCNVLTVDKDSVNFEEDCSIQSNNDSNSVSEEIAVPIQITDPDHSDEELTKEHSDIEGTIRLFNDTLVLNDGINKSQDNILLTVRDSIDYEENVTDQTCTPENTVDIEIDQTVTLIHDKLTLHEPVVKSHTDSDPSILEAVNDEREHSILEANEVTELNHMSNTTDSDYNLEKERDEILNTSKAQSVIVLRQQEIEIISAEGSASSTPDPDYCAEEKLVEYETNTQTILSKSNAANSTMIILSDKNKPKHYNKTSRENKHAKKSKTLALIVEKLRARVSLKSYNVPVPEYRNDSPIDLSVSAVKISEHRHAEEPSVVDISVNKLHDAPEIKTYNKDDAAPGCDKDSGTNGVHVMDTQMKHLQLDDNFIIEHGHEDHTFKLLEVNCKIRESIVSELKVWEPKVDNQIVIQENFEQDQMKEGEGKETLLKDVAVVEDIADKSKNNILIVENADTEMVDENYSLTNNNKQSISDPREFGMPEDKIQTFDNTNTVNQVYETFNSNECKLSKKVGPADSLNIKIFAIPEDQLDATTITHHRINGDEFGPLKTTDDNISKELIKEPGDHLHIEEVTFVQDKMISSANSIHSNSVEQIDPDDTVLSVEDGFSEEVINLQDDHSKIIIQEDKMNSVDNTDQVDEVDVEISKPFEVYVCKEMAEQQIDHLSIEENTIQEYETDSITNTDRSKTNIQINKFEAGTSMEYNLSKETVNMQDSHLKMEEINTLENKIDSADNIGRIEEVNQADAETLKSADDDANGETAKMQNVLDPVINSDYSNKGDAAYIFESEKIVENNFNKDTKDIQIDEVSIQNDETDASANTKQIENVKEVEVDQFLKSSEKYLAKEMIEEQNSNITIQEYPMDSFKNNDHIDKVDQIVEHVIIPDSKLDTPENTDRGDQAIGEITLKSVNHLQEVMDMENDDNTDRFNQVDLTLKSVEENLFLENDPLNIENHQDNEIVLGRKDKTEEILKSNDENIVVDKDHKIKDQSNTREEETDPVRLVHFNIAQDRSSLIETTEPCAEFLVKERIEPINISDQMETHEIQVEDIAKEEVLIIDPSKECQRSVVLDDKFRAEIKKTDIFEEHKINEELSTSDDNPTSVESLVIDEENQYLVEECDKSDVSCRDSVISDCEEITNRRDCLDIQIVENSQSNCTINKKSETLTLINENIPSDHEAIDPKDSVELVQSNVIVSAGEESPLLNDIQQEMENRKILVSQDVDINNSTADKISYQESCNTAGESISHLSIYHQVIEAENYHLNVEHNETEPLQEEVLTVINEVVEEPKSEIIESKYSCDDDIIITDKQEMIEADHNEIEMKDVHPESSINHLIVIRETNIVPSNLIEINITSQQPDCAEQHIEHDTQIQVNDAPVACETIESEMGHVDIEKEFDMESTQIHEIVSVNNEDESITKDKSDAALIDVEQSCCHEIVDANQCIIQEINDKEDFHELTVDNDTMVDKTEQNKHQEMEVKSGTEIIESQINYEANVEGDSQNEIIDSPDLINIIDATESGERIIENCVEDNIKLVKADIQEISLSNVELVTSDNISGHDAHVNNIQSSLNDNFKIDEKVVDAQNELINAECLNPEPKSNAELFTTLDKDNSNEDITESSLCLDEQYQDNKRRHMPLYSLSSENLSVIETPHDISIMEHSDVDIPGVENESSLLLNTDSPVINLPLETSDSKTEQLDLKKDTTEGGYSSYDAQAQVNDHLIATLETVAQNEIPNDKHLDENVECEVIPEAQIDNQVITVQIDETDTQPFSNDNLSDRKQSMKIEDDTEYHDLEIDSAEESVHVSKDCLNINDQNMSSIEQTNNLTPIDPNKQQDSEVQDDEEHVEIDIDLQENFVQIISNPLIIKNQETVAPIDVVDIKKPTDTNFATKINVTEIRDLQFSNAKYKQLVCEHSNFRNEEIAPIDSIDNQRPTTDSLEAKQQSIEVQYDHKHDDTDEQTDQEPCVKITQDLNDNREKAQIYDQLDTNMLINDTSNTNNQTMEENNDKTYYVAEMQLEEIKCGQIISDCSNDNNQEFTTPLEQTNSQTINVNDITINDHSIEDHDDKEICDTEESPSGEKIVKVTIDSSIDTQIPIEDNETTNQEAVEEVIQKDVVIEIDERKCLQVMPHDLKLCNQEISMPNHTVNNHIPAIDNLTTNQQVITPQDDVETRLDEKESVIEPIDHFNVDNHEIATPVNIKIIIDDNSPIIEETEAVKVHLRKHEHEIELNEEKIQEAVCDHLNVNNQQIAEPIVISDAQLPISAFLISEETKLEVENENKQDSEVEPLSVQNKKSESPIDTTDEQISIRDNLATKQPPIMQDDQEYRGNYLIAENQDTAVPIDLLENEKSIDDRLVTKQLSTVQDNQERHDSEIGHSEEKFFQLACDNLDVSQKNVDSINQTDIKIPDKGMFATDPQVLECHQGSDMEVDVRKCVEPDQTNLVISSIDTQNSINDNLNENKAMEQQDIEVSLHEVKYAKPDDEHSSVNQKLDSQILITDSLTTEQPYAQNDQTHGIDTRLDDLKSKCDHVNVNEEITIPIDEMHTQIPIVNNVTSDQPGIEAYVAETGVEAICGKLDHNLSNPKSDDDQVNVNEEITTPIDPMHTQILIIDNLTPELAIEAHVAETGVDEAKCGKSGHDPSIDIPEIVVPIDTIDIQIPTDYNLITKPPAIEMREDKNHLLEVQIGEAECVQPSLLSSDTTNIQLLANIHTVEEHDQQENHYVHEKENIDFNDQWVIKCEEIILPTEDIYTSTPEYSNDSSDSMEDIPSVKHIQTQTNFPISFEDEFSYIKFHAGKVDANKNNINIPNRATEIECENEESLPIGKLNINFDEFVPIEETENAERASALFAENCFEEYEQVTNDNLSIGEEITEVQKNDLDHENVFKNVRITSVYSEQVTEVDSEILMAENDKEADASILKHFNSINNLMIIKQIESFMNVHNINQGISEVGVESNKNLDSLAVLPMDANTQMLILDPQLVDNFIEEPASTDGSETLEDRLIIDDKEIEEHNSNELNPGIVLDADDSDPGVLIEYIDINNTFIEEVCNSGEPFSLIDESDAMIDLQNDDLILDNQNIFDDDQEIDDRNSSAVITRRDHSYSLNINKGFFKEFGPLNKSMIVKVLVGIKDGNGEIIYKEVDTRVDDNTNQSVFNPYQEIPDAPTVKYTQSYSQISQKNNSEVCDHPSPEVIENIEVIDLVDRRRSVNEEIELAPQTVSTDIVGWKKYKRFFSDRKTNNKSVTEELLTKLKNNGSEVDVVLEALKKSCPSIKNIMNEKHALKNLESATANNATVDNLEKRKREVRTAVKIFKKRLAYEEMKKISTKENNVDRNLTEDKKAGVENNMKISDVHNNKQLSTDDGTAVVKNNVSILNNFKRISISDKVHVIKNTDVIGETNNNSPRINAAISSLILNKSNDTATSFAADKFKNKIVIKGTKRGFDKPLIISQLSNLNRNKNILEAFIKMKDNAVISKSSDHEIPMNIKDTISTCQSKDVINKTDVLRHRQPANISQVLFKPYEKFGAPNEQIKTIVTPEKSTKVQEINEVQECISVVDKNSSHDVVSLAIKTLDMYNVPENVRNNILTTNKHGIVSINNRAVVKLQKINIDKLKEEFISTNVSQKYTVNNLNQRVMINNGEEEIVTSNHQINLENQINNSTDQSKSIASKSDIPTEVMVVNHNVESIFPQQKDKVSSSDVSVHDINVNDRTTDSNSAIFVQNKKNINILNVNENCNAKIIKPVRRILKVIRRKNGKISTFLPKKNDSEIFIINPAVDSNEHRVISNNLIKNIDKKTSKRDAKTALDISDNLEKSTLKILSTGTSPDAVNVKGKVLVTMPNKKQLMEKSFSTTCDRLAGKIDNNNELNAEKDCKLSKDIHVISTEINNGPVEVVTDSSNSTERNLDEIIRNNETVLKTLEMCSLSQEVRKNLMCVDRNGEIIINDEAFIELGKIINNIEMPPEILQKISKLLWDNSALKNNADTVKNNYGSQEIKEYLLAAIDNRRVSMNLIEDLASVLKESRTNSGLLADSLKDSGINERKSSVFPTNESLLGSTEEPVKVIEDSLSGKDFLNKNTAFNATSETVNKKSSLTQRRIIKINAPKRKIIFPLTNTNDKVKFKKIYLDSKINIKRTENRILTRLRGNSIKNVEEEQILQNVHNLETPEQNDNETARLKENILNLQNNSTSHDNILNLKSINVDNNLITETVEDIRIPDMAIVTEEEENLKNTLHSTVDSSEISDKNEISKRRQSIKDIYDTAVILKQNVQDAGDLVNETGQVTTTNDENGKCVGNVDGKNSDSSLVAKDAKRELKRKCVDEVELLQDLKDSDDYIVVIVGDKGTEVRQLPATQEVKVVDKSFDSPKAKKCRFEKKNKNKRAGSKSNKTVTKEPTTDSSKKRRKRKNLGIKEFPCTQCDKVCKFSNALLVHMRIHTNERPFACELCDKRFKVKSALKCHSVVHTAARPYECDQCNKRFKTKTVLESHMRFHVGEKRFECDICNKKFIQKQSLMIHLNLHTGATPWVCDICFKRFKQPATLVKHHRNHTLKRPYSCKDCRKYFSTSAGLRTHRRMHDKEQEILNS